LSFYEGIGVTDFKIEESESASEVLCTNSTALVRQKDDAIIEFTWMFVLDLSMEPVKHLTVTLHTECVTV
jgi:hypothetical protein